MKFNFKQNDMVRCRVLRATKINKQFVQKGSVVDLVGNMAMQLLSGANPACKQMMDHKPVEFQERDTEMVVSTPDPVKAKPRKRKQPEDE